MPKAAKQLIRMMSLASSLIVETVLGSVFCFLHQTQATSMWPSSCKAPAYFPLLLRTTSRFVSHRICLLTLFLNERLVFFVSGIVRCVQESFSAGVLS